MAPQPDPVWGTRRRLLQAGVTGLGIGVSGCLRFISGSDGTDQTPTGSATDTGDTGRDIKDRDGDGVINTEDYAPWDHDVQEKSDLVGNASTTPTPPEQETTTTTAPGTSAESIVADFEEETVDAWRMREDRSPDLLEPTTTAKQGEYATRAAFEAHAYLPFDPITPSEVRFWWQAGAVDDNELAFSLHEAAGDQWASAETAAFGIEIGAENQSVVVVNPPFPNGESYEQLTDQPAPDTWYHTRFYDIDFSTNTVSVELSDASGTTLGTVTDHAFGADVDSLTQFQVKNSMNFSEADAVIDYLTRNG